jgi:hypothetical protein
MQIKCTYLIISALILKIKLKVSGKCYAITKLIMVMNRFVREEIMTSPPNFRNSFGIPSRPTALPDFNETRARYVYKMYASIMENTIMAFLEDKSVLGESQGAFRKNRSPEDHLFTLNGICSQRKSNRFVRGNHLTTEF